MKFVYLLPLAWGINPPVEEKYPCKEMIKHKYAMRKMIYLSALLLLFVLPIMAQQPLFPTPAKVQNGKARSPLERICRYKVMAGMLISWPPDYKPS